MCEKRANEAVTELGPDAQEEDKEHKSKEIKFKIACETIQAIKDKILDIGKFRVPPKREPQLLLQLLFQCIGLSKDLYETSSTHKVDWEKMRLLMNDELVASMIATDPTAIDKSVFLSLEEQKPELEESLKEEGTYDYYGEIYAMICEWIVCLMDLRTSCDEKREREEAAKKAAEEEEDAE